MAGVQLAPATHPFLQELHTMGGRPEVPMPMMPQAPPDYADQAVRDAAAREKQKALTGSARRRSFITSQGGAGGEARVIPALGVKSLFGT